MARNECQVAGALGGASADTIAGATYRRTGIWHVAPLSPGRLAPGGDLSGDGRSDATPPRLGASRPLGRMGCSPALVVRGNAALQVAVAAHEWAEDGLRAGCRQRHAHTFSQPR